MQKLSRCLVDKSGAQGEQREGREHRPRKNRNQQWKLRRSAQGRENQESVQEGSISRKKSGQQC